MRIIPVNTESDAAMFIEMAPPLYKNDPEYIRPLDKDLAQVFDKEKNRTFNFGEVQRWILKDENGLAIGRIAAFVNKRYKNKGDDVPVGGVGFFECINSQDAANLLLNTAVDWLKERGMQAMDGPINFGERDRWWGMVVEGFYQPLYCMNYNPAYYVELFENFGFKPFFYQICFAMKPKEPLSPKMWERHDLLAQDPKFSSSNIKKSNLDKYAEDFLTVYNKAWAGHGGLKQLSKPQVLHMFKSMKPVMDENIVFFIYYDKEPIGIFTNIPDLNQWFKYLNGKFGLLEKIKFLWIKKFKPNKKFTGLVFGIVPEWQGKGADAYLIGEAGKVVQAEKSPYTEYEMQWIGDFNPKMLNVAQSLGDSYVSRKLCTYRYLFDRQKEFVRHPVI